LEMVLPGFHPEKSYPAEDEANERPFRKNRCAQCPYEEILNQLRESAQNTSQKLVIIGDPGCQVKLAGELDAKYAIGSAISVAAGLAEVDAEIKPVAMLGDSAFFHSTIPALCEIGVRQTSVLILVIDNNGAVSTGAQTSPSNFPDQTNHMLNLNIVDIAKACGIGYAQTANLNLEYPTLVPIIQGGLETKGPALVVITVQCQSD